MYLGDLLDGQHSFHSTLDKLQAFCCKSVARIQRHGREGFHACGEALMEQALEHNYGGYYLLSS